MTGWAQLRFGDGDQAPAARIPRNAVGGRISTDQLCERLDRSRGIRYGRSWGANVTLRA
ncbi:hypothetical protein FHR33_006590 [Nonomuraea dietziae]|uniref:Uncharacterized protein n=1 Tax=Nonomuraea dietziae TaxID=65515 RepID=A0A7W5VBU3_9ACTN|nr:hypothetical protein [Nonomuraea dietziae]